MYGFKLYELWDVLSDSPYPRMELKTMGFYDTLLAYAKKEGYVSNMEQQPCPTCGAVRTPLILKWTGPLPTLFLRNIGEIHALKLAEIARIHTIYIRRSNKAFIITLTKPFEKRKNYLVFKDTPAIELQRQIEEWTNGQNHS